MAISHKDIARSIYEGSKDHQGDESSYYKDVVRFLNKRRLLSKSPSILAHLKKIINTEQGILEAKVSTAVRLGATERYSLIQELKTRYKAKDVVLQEVINESLLGGMRVEVGDEVIDLSTKGKILKLQTYLMRSV
jgi:F-type H+-transporting ATPase subunit delta